MSGSAPSIKPSEPGRRGRECRTPAQPVGFNHVVAPFDGVVTRRNVDVGDLINAGNGGRPGAVTVAQFDPLRLYVYVPRRTPIK